MTDVSFNESNKEVTVEAGCHLGEDTDYLIKQYPQWDDFMKICKEMDPDQIFLTDYWKERLGLPKWIPLSVTMDRSIRQENQVLYLQS